MKRADLKVTRVEEVTGENGRKYRRLFVKLTPAQKAEYRRKLAEAEHDLPELRRWAKRGLKQAKQRVEAVFGANEQAVLSAVDQYAAEHDLPNRGAVVRVALGKLLGLELAIPHHGWKPGRSRLKTKRQSKANR